MEKGKTKRQYYTAEQKVSLLKRHLVEREEISAICEEMKLHPTVFYEWQKRFFEYGVNAFETADKGESKKLQDKVATLESRLQRKDSALAELIEEHITLKKSLGED